MKTPEEIKRGLECCGDARGECSKCPYNGVCFAEGLVIPMAREALDRILELEASIVHAKMERDALLDILVEATRDGCVCTGCKHSTGIDDACEANDFDCNECKVMCMCRTCKDNSNYEWRGV